MMVLSDKKRSAKQIAAEIKYGLSPKGKATRKRYRVSPAGKASMKKYESTPKGKALRKKIEKKFDSSPKRKIIQKRTRDKPAYKKKVHDERIELRTKVFSNYSKLHSNSDIPCCRCCGEKFHLEFMSLDHINGKKQMDSEPELVKLGYSSKLIGLTLLKWIIKNNFPKGFQTLCHNCNQSKGHSKYNTCAHERKHLEETFDRMTAQSSFEL
jgi:hypothetical protein